MSIFRFTSGIFWEGNFCNQIINQWKEGKFQLVSSPQIIEELIDVLHNFKIPMEEDLIEMWKNLIIKNSVIVIPIEHIKLIKEDPDDDKFIEAAVYGKADLIISQNKHLLRIKEYNKIKILKPEEAILYL
mgnify:CR=1 FL=1